LKQFQIEQYIAHTQRGDVLIQVSTYVLGMYMWVCRRGFYESYVGRNVQEFFSLQLWITFYLKYHINVQNSRS
jgi:hypothetical protein